MLSFLAENIGLIIAGSIELAVAGVLAGIIFDRHIKEKNRINLHGRESDLFRGTLYRNMRRVGQRQPFFHVCHMRFVLL